MQALAVPVVRVYRASMRTLAILAGSPISACHFPLAQRSLQPGSSGIAGRDLLQGRNRLFERVFLFVKRPAQGCIGLRGVAESQVLGGLQGL